MTVSVPAKEIALVGVNVRIATCDPPGGIVPSLKVDVMTALGTVIALMVSVVLPLFVMVSVPPRERGPLAMICPCGVRVGKSRVKVPPDWV